MLLHWPRSQGKHSTFAAAGIFVIDNAIKLCRCARDVISEGFMSIV
jgi:hypothetical protein